MSHIRANKVGKKLTRLAALLCMGALATGTAGADIAVKHSLPAAVTDIQPLTLSAAALRGGLDEVVLDWRTPSQTFTLELAPSNWVEQANLVLWADPVNGAGARSTGRDVRVSLNGGAPVAVELDHSGFTARIPLPLEDIRPGTNTVRIALAQEPDSCLRADDGGWTVDLLRSRLETRARPREGAILLDELRSWLGRPTAKPLLAGIRTHGGDAEAWEALIAQGLALHAYHVPRYALGGDAARAEIQLIAGTRLALAGLIDDAAVLDGTGARIAVLKGRPLRLVLTGDTEAEVREAVDSFATNKIPDARRRIATPMAFALAGRLDTDRATLRRRTPLSDLGGLDFAANWGAGQSSVQFDVRNASAARGTLHLDIERSPLIGGSSHVDVRLNGRDLGRLGLADLRTRGELAVPQGWLRGRDNRLTMLPSLLPTSPGCAPDLTAAGISVRGGSRIDILSAPGTEAGDLAHLTDGTSPLVDRRGEGTTIVLPASQRQRAHALRILGRIARSAGGGLTLSAYKSGEAVAADEDVLVVGDPSADVDIPRSLRLALSERSRGGVAGVYPESGRWVGVIAPEAAGSLGALANALVGSAWYDLSGGIARIDGSRVHVAHAAFGGGVADDLRPIFDADSMRVDAEQLGHALEAEIDTSVVTLAKAWRRIETPPAFRLIGGLGRDAGLRGPFQAPRARQVASASDDGAPALTLRDATGGLRAGLPLASYSSLKDLDAVMSRAAHRIRHRLGLKPIRDVRPVSHAADAHFSFPAMLLMLAFALSAFGLARASNDA